MELTSYIILGAALLIIAGRAFWRTNQRKLVIQGG